MALFQQFTCATARLSRRHESGIPASQIMGETGHIDPVYSVRPNSRYSSMVVASIRSMKFPLQVYPILQGLADRIAAVLSLNAPVL